mgnify:CR=1 FL=1
MTKFSEHTPALLPIKRAAEVIGLEYRQLLSAANEGLIPTYRLRTSRYLVNVAEVISVMKVKGSEQHIEEETASSRILE